MRVKLFMKREPTGGKKGRNQQELENEINAWLDQNPTIKVVDIKQSPSATITTTALYVSLWYESQESNRSPKPEIS